jgi:sigma-B regulation protein RsbU (phosphoserine phosphatase)
MAGAEYEVGETRLGDGEVLVVYSDGVSEANNLAEEEFGLDRLKNVLKANLKGTASSMRDKVESALSTFTGSAPANDDITLVIVKKGFSV